MTSSQYRWQVGPTMRRILQALPPEGATTTEMAALLANHRPVSRASVAFALRRLENLGLVEGVWGTTAHTGQKCRLIFRRTGAPLPRLTRSR